jgi:hypothetical protein
MLVISVPLSETIVLVFPRLAMRLFIFNSRKVVPRQGCVGNQTKAFACKVVDLRQNTEPAAVGEGVADDVQTPAPIGREGRARGRLVPKARFLPPRLRTVSFSSR